MQSCLIRGCRSRIGVDHHFWLALPIRSIAADEIPVAILGHDPVAYFTAGKPTRGLPEFGMCGMRTGIALSAPSILRWFDHQRRLGYF
jgi:hypothetical protein